MHSWNFWWKIFEWWSVGQSAIQKNTVSIFFFCLRLKQRYVYCHVQRNPMENANLMTKRLKSVCLVCFVYVCAVSRHPIRIITCRMHVIWYLLISPIRHVIIWVLQMHRLIRYESKMWIISFAPRNRLESNGNISILYHYLIRQYLGESRNALFHYGNEQCTNKPAWSGSTAQCFESISNISNVFFDCFVERRYKETKA